MVAGDAAGGRDSGKADSGGNGFHDEDGFSDGAVGTEPADQPATVGEDGAGSRMRPGVRVGSVAPLAGRSGDGACGTGVVEEAVYSEKTRDQGLGTRD